MCIRNSIVHKTGFIARTNCLGARKETILVNNLLCMIFYIELPVHPLYKESM